MYPGANHTRFDHSIGYFVHTACIYALPSCIANAHTCSVFYLAREFSLHLQRQLRLDFPTRPDLFSDGEVICVEIAGLCHDLGMTNTSCHMHVGTII